MKYLNVCLTWHNLNSSNYGVSALAISHIGLLIDAASRANIKLKLCTFGTDGVDLMEVRKTVEKQFNINIPHIEFSLRRQIKDVFRFKKWRIFILNGFDFVIDLGEGDSFTDIYGVKRFFLLSITKFIPIIGRRKIILAPQTIGPFEHQYGNVVAKWLMRRCFRVFARDHKSAEIANEMGVNVIQTADVAFALPFQKGEKIKDSVGLNVSALLWNGGYSGKNQFSLTIDYRKVIYEIIDGLVRRGKTVHLISHVISLNIPVENDFETSNFIKRKYINSDGVIVAPEFKSPIEAKNYISCMEFFSGSRMHATIGALSAGVPVIPIAYSRKFEGVFGSLGYQYTLDAKKLNTEELISKFFYLFDEKILDLKKDVDKAKAEAQRCNMEYCSEMALIFSGA